MPNSAFNKPSTQSAAGKRSLVPGGDLRFCFPLLFLALTSPLTAAEISKWVDAQGRVHYSDQPPPGVVVKKIDPPPPPLPTPKAVKDALKSGPKTVAEKDLDYRKRKVDAEETAEKNKKSDAEAKLKLDNCTNAKASLRARQEGVRMFTLNEQGERVYPDDTERAQLVANAQKEVDSWCK